MTYREALNNGYYPCDVRYHRGYISRKIEIDNQEVKVVTSGYRKGDMYVEVPTWESTRYHKRIYLAKRGWTKCLRE